VAKYIAVSTLEASLDVASMAASSTKIFVLEVMGRHAGWIAAAGGLVDSTIPIVILFPEIEFNEKAFLAKVDKNVKDYGYCTIVVSEGTKWPNGKFLAEQETRDDFGHAQLGGAAPVVANIVKKSLGYKFHWAVADYLQRSARHLASNEDIKQAYALGKAAVEMAIEGKNAIMPAIIRTSNNPYEWEIGYGELKDIANVEKMMPENYISKDGFSITNECREYLLPLIEGENYPPYNNGLPEYVVLKKSKVNKKLPPFKI
jgi:6-phosphofructokinase 1